MEYRVFVLPQKTEKLETLRGELENRGYDIIKYQDSVEDTLEPYLKGNNSSYLIMDITRPFMNGLKFVEQLNNRDIHLKDLAVLSGFIADEDLQVALKMGCRVFPKPLSVVSLLDWLENSDASDSNKKEVNGI